MFEENKVFNSSSSFTNNIQAPIAPKNEVALEQEYSYSYKILDLNHIITSDIHAELIYPEDVKEFIEIINVEVNRDEYTEEQIKKEYKNKIDEKN